ncbi:hypothetical protein ABBQ32_002177 [Trebouxia sp. C0010 RCD-2024]
MMFIFCCVRATNKTRTVLPRYFLPNRFEVACIYMQTMATTCESADKSATPKVFDTWKIRGQNINLMLQLHHLPIPVNSIETDLVQCLLIKGFGIVNNRTDTYIILNAQCCTLQFRWRLSVCEPKLFFFLGGTETETETGRNSDETLYLYHFSTECQRNVSKRQTHPGDPALFK